MPSYVDVKRLAPRVAFTLSEEVAGWLFDYACIFADSVFDVFFLSLSTVWNHPSFIILEYCNCLHIVGVKFFQPSHHRFDDLYAKVSEPRGEWMWRRGWQIFVTSMSSTIFVYFLTQIKHFLKILQHPQFLLLHKTHVQFFLLL